MKSRRPVDWQALSPEIAEHIRLDQAFVKSVDSLLEAREDEIDSLIPGVRLLLQQLIDIPITDERLADEINAACRFLCESPDDAEHYLNLMTT